MSCWNTQHSSLEKNKGKVQFTLNRQPMIRTNSLRRVETSTYSHRPQIHELPFEIYPQRTKTEVSRRDLLQRLINDRNKKVQNNRAQKAQQQQKEIASCTFQPTINEQSKKLAVSREGNCTFERLYAQGLQKQRATEHTSASLQHDKENCTFKPNIGEKSQFNTGLEPIYKRLQKILADKREAAKRLQQQKEQTQMRQTPQVNFHSKQILENKGNFKKNVLDRLFGYMREKNDRLEQKMQEREFIQKKECTFTPQINYASEPVYEGNFLQRQECQAEKAKQKALWLKEQTQATFRPTINHLSHLLVQAERQGQTEQEMIRRLHAHSQEQRQAQIQRVQAQVYRQCTFQPVINPISKATHSRPHKHKCSCKPSQEHFRFQPQINQKSRQMAQKGRERPTTPKNQQVRLELEYRQMKQCTFKPKTNAGRARATSQTTSLKDVAGIQSYQKRIDKKLNKQKQEEQLRQKLFALQKRYKERDHTVPEPFNLAKPQSKFAKIKAQSQQQFHEKHPFRPELYPRS